MINLPNTPTFSTKPFEIGLTSFVELSPDPRTGHKLSPAERTRNLLEEIVLADQVGLDVYGVGEHHRVEYVSSAPEVFLAAAAALTKNIRLTSAVTVLSSDDPVRVFSALPVSTWCLMGERRSSLDADRSSSRFRCSAMICMTTIPCFRKN